MAFLWGRKDFRRTKGSASNIETEPSAAAEMRLRGKERSGREKKERAVMEEEWSWREPR